MSLFKLLSLPTILLNERKVTERCAERGRDRTVVKQGVPPPTGGVPPPSTAGPSMVTSGDPLPNLFLADFWLPICQKSRSHHQISQNLNLNMRNSRGDSQVAKNTIKSGLVAGHRGRFDILVGTDGCIFSDIPGIILNFTV